MKFSNLFGALSGSTLLEKSYTTTEKVHDATKMMFESSFGCVMDESLSCDISVVQKDKEINRQIIEIRRQLFNYVSTSSNPNVSGVLSLTSIVIDYERIGDYTKNISQLPSIVTGRLTNGYYNDKVLEMYELLKKLFAITKRAFTAENEEEAKEGVRIHETVKDLHLKILREIDSDRKVTRQEAIVYVLLSGFFRRINGHLSNICTAIYQPFPKIGFA